jgi:glycolate oxidase subunit GlcD
LPIGFLPSERAISAETAQHRKRIKLAIDNRQLAIKRNAVDQLIETLRAVVGADAVLAKPEELLVYECDGLTQHKYLPRAVVFPESTEATAEVMRTLAHFGVPFTPRGAGTGLSGGALALNNGVVIELARMRKILRIDPENRIAVVQTGVVNLHVSRAVAHLGLHYIPDPSSQPTCTIGGNIAENAGGIHCLKYGTTTDHVLGARVVLADGDIVDLGSGESGNTGYDLLGVFIGSEGTFGIATEATLRLTPVPPVVRTLLAEFSEVDDASHAVSAIIAAGVMPAALEMMDHEIIKAIEASVFAAGLPPDAGAALLIELDGIEAGIDDEAERVKGICMNHGARSCRLARDESERKKLWAARKGAFGAVGRIAPDSMIQDAVVPRSRLPQVLQQSYDIARKYRLILANVFHAGDGNLHPLICFDSRSADEVLRVKEAGRELMELCVRAGGSITGEHGVGLDKRDYLPLIFSEDDMDVMLRVRAAFDPSGLCNPGKIIPMLRGCGEARAVQRQRNGDGETGGRGDTETAEREDTGTGRGGDAETGNVGDTEKRSSVTTVVASASTTSPDHGITQLSAIVGEANITTSLHHAFAHSPRHRVPPSPRHPVTPSPLIVAPGSIEEVSEVMKLASSEGWKVIPAGAGTWLEAGNPLHRVDLVLSTKRLNRIIEHEPADLIAAAEAGVALNDFNTELSRQGQWLPLDPPNDGRATIGGVVATGMSGAHSYGYGPPRRSVIGMKVVLADGRVVKAGGRVVKNVAGYDLCKLFTGSYGTLGVITELTFKLRPMPFETRTVLAWGSPDKLLLGANALITAKLFPVAVELLSPEFARQAEFSEGDDAVLLVRFVGSADAVGYQTSRACNLLKDWSRNAGPLADNDTTVWRQLAQIPIRCANKLVWRANCRPAAMRQLLALIEESNMKQSLEAPMWQASIGEGRIRTIEPADIDQHRFAESLLRLRLAVQTLDGSLVVENASPEIKSTVDAWGDFGTRTKLMQRIKQQLDPENTLSPGRFSIA